MKSNSDSKIARRTLLHAAAGAVGSTALGLVPGTALANVAAAPERTVTPKPASDIFLAYWDGGRLIPAQKLATADRTLDDVRLTLRGSSHSGSLGAIDFVAMVPTESGTVRAAFQAWTAPPRGSRHVSFRMRVDPAKGLLFSTQQSTGKREASMVADHALGLESTSPFKLREGTYVLAERQVDWAQYDVVQDNSDEPLVQRQTGLPADFQHVLITIERV